MTATNPYESRKNAIRSFVKENVSTYVDVDKSEEIRQIADGIISTGIKTADAYHVASAIIAGSDYFLTTDDRLLKYKTNDILLIDPTEFIREWEVSCDDDN